MSVNKYKSAFVHGCKYIERSLGMHFPRMGLHAQFQLFIELSMRCNMKCSYCDLWSKDHSLEVEPARWKEVLPELLDILGQPKIQFSGGEPLLSPVIFDVLQISVERGAYPGIVTNGRLLNQKAIARLSELDISNINISLDDDRPEVFDHVRNSPGHTQLLLNNIAALQSSLREHHCHTLVYLKPVIHAENADRLVHMARLAQDLGCTIAFQPLSSPIGRHFRHDWFKNEPLWPTGERLAVLHGQIDELVALKENGAAIGNSVEDMQHWHQYFDAPDKFKKNDDESPCLIGYNNLYVFSNGDVKYCPARPMVGNIKNQNIRDILMSKKAEDEIVKMRRCQGKGCVKTCMTQKSLGEMVGLFLKFVGRR